MRLVQQLLNMPSKRNTKNVWVVKIGIKRHVIYNPFVSKCSLILPSQLLCAKSCVFPIQDIVILTALSPPAWHHSVFLYLLLPPVQELIISPGLQVPISIASSQYSEFSLLKLPSVNPNFWQKDLAPFWLFQNQWPQIGDQSPLQKTYGIPSLPKFTSPSLQLPKNRGQNKIQILDSPNKINLQEQN